MRYLFSLGICIVCLHLSCSENPVGPDIKDPRTYTWRVDTLAYPVSSQTLMRSIWGSSPEDVYVVGHNSGAFGKMFKFDGGSWSSIDLHFGDFNLQTVSG